MKDLLQYCIGAIFGGLASVWITRFIFTDKLSELRKRTNSHILNRLSLFDIPDYFHSSSIVNELCFLRREYLKNDKNGADTFDSYAIGLISRFVEKHEDGYSLVRNINRGVEYTDPEVAKIIESAFYGQKLFITSLFEKNHSSLTGENDSISAFLNYLKTPYISKLGLMDHFSAEALKKSLKVSLV